MAIATKFPILPPSVLLSGAKKDTFIIGIGHNGEAHLGLMLQLVKNQKKGVAFLNTPFIVCQIGNASSFEKYRLSREIVDPINLNEEDKAMVLALNFTRLKTVISCNLRYRNGLNVTILEGSDKGTSSLIHSIQKFPDTEAPMGCALYNITYEGDASNTIHQQLDDNLQIIQFHLKDKD